MAAIEKPASQTIATAFSATTGERALRSDGKMIDALVSKRARALPARED